MTKNDKHNVNRRWVKWMTAALVLAMGLFLFTSCGSKSEDQKSTGSQPGVSQEQQSTDDSVTKDQTADKSQTDGKSDDSDGTATTGNDSASTGGSTSSSGQTDKSTETTAETCTIQINCALLVGQNLSGTGLETLVPSNGVILPTTKVTIQPGDSVYDVTLRAVKSKKIQMSTMGTEDTGTLYVQAISNIYEQAYNIRSGWIYLVNGKKPSVSCGLEKIKANDKLVWAYSLNLGNDL